MSFFRWFRLPFRRRAGAPPLLGTKAGYRRQIRVLQESLAAAERERDAARGDADTARELERDAHAEIERLKMRLKITEEAFAQQTEINLRDRERVASETAMYSRRIAEYETGGKSE